MLNTKSKKIKSYNCPFCLMSNHEIELNLKKKKISEGCFRLIENVKKFSLDSHPMVKGSVVGLDEAINEIKKLIKSSDQIHVDGLGCDQKAMYKIFDFAEKKKLSIDHMHSQKISNFYSGLQSFGGSFISFSELKNRSDFILFLGMTEKESSAELLIKRLSWNKKKKLESIFFLSDKEEKKTKFKSFCVDKDFLSNEVNFLLELFQNDKKFSKNKYKLLIKSFLESKYPVIIPKIKNENYDLIISSFNLVKKLNDEKPTKMFAILGLDNLAGSINSSVIKTGFPNAISFTEIGPFYDPNEFVSFKLMGYKDLQIFVSNFDFNPNVNFFKKNIFIGHPGLRTKQKFNVYIPTKTPGIDQDGIIVKFDSSGVLKLKRLFDSGYKTTSEVFDLIDQ